MKKSEFIKEFQEWADSHNINADSIVFYEDSFLYWSGGNFIKIPYRKVRTMRSMEYNLFIAVGLNICIFLNHKIGSIQIEFNS